MPGVREERAGGGLDQVAPAEPGEPASSAGPVKPSRRRRSFRPRRSALRRVIEHDAEAGRFVTFAHSRLRSRPCAAHGTQVGPGQLSTGRERRNAPATVAAPKNPQGNTFSTGLPPLHPSGPAPCSARTPGEPTKLGQTTINEKL